MEDMVMESGFWKDKRVFITGHTGFKGSWLSLWLQHLGAQVTGYALAAPTNPSLFEVAHVADGMRNISGDIRGLEHIASSMADCDPHIVIHMAAQSLVRYSYAHPVETYATNVLGTVHVLEATRNCRNVRVVVNVTSDKCYENREWLWGYRENEAMGGHDPYSSSKGCAELVTAAYRRSFFQTNDPNSPKTAVATVRAGNVIGGGDWAQDRLIPDIMRAVMAGKAVRIRNPSAVRPWQHVLVPLHGYLLLAEKLWHEGEKSAGGWNFGPADQDTQPVSWIAQRLTHYWGQDAGWERDGDQHPHEAHHLMLDSSKARALLAWQPKLHLDTALKWVVEWYQAYHAGQNMRDFTRQQIVQFEKVENVLNA